MIKAGTDQNFAHFCNLVYARDDLESVPDFRDRVRASVAELGGGVLAWGAPEALEWVDPEVETIVVTGGISEDSSGDFATIGDVLVERGEGETIEAFQRRAREFATEAGSDHVIFGGLPAIRFEEGETENGTTD